MHWMWKVTVNSTSAPLSNPLNLMSGLAEGGLMTKNPKISISLRFEGLLKRILHLLYFF